MILTQRLLKNVMADYLTTAATKQQRETSEANQAKC
jgi:hypothetical protein